MKILLVLVLVFGTLISAGAQEENFALVKREDNISIFERWIKFPKSDPPIDAREVKSEFFFNNTIENAILLLQDEKRIGKWQHHVTEFKVFDASDSLHWHEYSYHDIPWPVSDQDHFLRYTVASRKPDLVFITFESRDDEVRAPLKKGVTRMDLSGSWTFQQLNAKQCKATYRILSRPSSIPKFLTDPIIRNNMMTTIQRFIALMEGRAPK